MITGADLVTAARSWVGVKYRHQGRNRNGVDCIGLPIAVCQEAGLLVGAEPPANYTIVPNTRTFLANFEAFGCTRVPAREIVDGMLLVFSQEGYPCHVGLRSTMHGRSAVVHAHMGPRKVIEEVLRPESHLMAAFRIPGVTY